MSSLANGEMFKCSVRHWTTMEPFQLAWERQPDDRQWEKPEGDDPRTLYQMLMTSVDRFGDLKCFGFIQAPGMPRTHMSYNQFGDLATAVGKQLAAVGVKAGDRVALILNNSVEWAALSYGANGIGAAYTAMYTHCLLYTSPSPRDRTRSRMPSSA